MYVVSGISASGMETVLSGFAGTLGIRNTAELPYRHRSELKARALGNAGEYERYLDKFSAAPSAQVVADIEALTPDGVWPIYNMDPAQLRPLTGGKIDLTSAARLGGSTGLFSGDEIHAILVVMTDPREVWLRRSAMRMQFRALDLKYKDDLGYRAALAMQFRDWDTTPKSMLQAMGQLADYVNSCMYTFADKAKFIDGNGAVLTFATDAGTVTAENRNIKPHPMRGRVPDSQLYMPYDSQEYESVRNLWGTVKSLADGSTAPRAPEVEKTKSWFCARIRMSANDNMCSRCVASRGDYVFADAKPGWDQEPCAYEVAYGPEPHKTVEQSITEHNWGVLP